MDPIRTTPSAFIHGSRSHSQIPPLLVPETARPLTKTPSKKRSLSDSTPVLSPSPNLKEPLPRTKDDDSVVTTPSRASRRSSDLSARGLIIQMPPRDPYFNSLQSNSGRTPQSPQVEYDPREAYGSPSSVLPRHSRGLDFSRAATHLHHSTLAEPSSPESSPTVTQRTFLPPSRRSSVYSSMVLESPRLNLSSAWSGSLNSDRGFFPRSVGSTNTMTSDASSSSSDENDVVMLQDDPDDAIITTPQVRRSDASCNVTPFAVPVRGADQNSLAQAQSPGPSAFVKYRRNVLNRRTSRRSRGSWSNRSRTASPDTHAMGGENRSASYTTPDLGVRSPPSRRDSLSLGIGTGLHITSSNESGDDNAFGISPMTPGVVRRPVTRRSNMLPKTKNFARIRAALQEESAPVDSEARRESEVVRQVRVNDVGRKDQSAVMPSSPDLTPTVANLSHDSSEMSDIEALSAKGGVEGPKQLPDFRRDSIHKEFLPSLRNRTQTPPPPNFSRHRSSSGVSEDTSMDSPYMWTPPSSVFSTASAAFNEPKVESEFAAAGQFQPPILPSSAELTFKANNKRRRDEDFDVNSLKRRAVSPGISTHSSPVLGQSPASAGGAWGKQSKSSNSEKSSGGSATEEKTGSSSSTGYATPTLGPKRVGLQGMADTNDGLMSMSIE